MRKLDVMCPGESPYAGRLSDSPSRAIITFHDRKHSFSEVELRRVRRTEKQLCPDSIGKSSNANGMMKCDVVQLKDVGRRHGKSHQ